jgi:hypothetical protein
LQRLFSTFPNGWPGSGLLLQRVITATFLFCAVFTRPIETPQLSLVIPHLIGLAAAIFLLIGLWTPISGTLIAVVEVWVAFSCAFRGIPILLATSGATLAMIGPGAWSMDARLFGRKHFEISHR